MVSHKHVYPIENPKLRNHIKSADVGDVIKMNTVVFDKAKPVVVDPEYIDYSQTQTVVLRDIDINETLLPDEIPVFCQFGQNGVVVSYSIGETDVFQCRDYDQIMSALDGMKDYFGDDVKGKRYDFCVQNPIGLSFQILEDLSKVSFVKNKSYYNNEVYGIIVSSHIILDFIIIPYWIHTVISISDCFM